MKLLIDHHCSTPIYAQIVEQIKEAIVYGDFDKTKPLPSIRKLSKEIAVNSLTIQKALKILESQGYLTIKKGVGAFINIESLPSDLTARLSLIKDDLRVVLLKARSLELDTNEIDNVYNELMNEITEEKK